MEVNLIVIDNFYANPDPVRAFALQQPFAVEGNYPGMRTACFLTDDVKQAIALHMQFAGKITNWLDYSGSFQIATANDRTWVHSDENNRWSAVCYLTPDAPHTGGTGFFKHKETGQYSLVDSYHEGYDYTKWDLVDRVGNRYNRLVIFRGSLFHASMDYFGNNLENGRLFQLFFFNTEGM